VNSPPTQRSRAVPKTSSIGWCFPKGDEAKEAASGVIGGLNPTMYDLCQIVVQDRESRRYFLKMKGVA